MRSILQDQKASLLGCGLLPLNFNQIFPNLPPMCAYLLDNCLVLFCLLNSLHVFTFLSYTLFFAGAFSFEETMAQLQDFAGVFSATLYILVFFWKQKEVLRVIASVEQELPQRSLAGMVYMDMGNCVKSCRKITIVMASTFIVGTIFHGFQPLSRGLAYKAFPYHTVYPFTWAYQSPYYELLYALQMVEQIHMGWQYASVMTLFVSAARMMTVQFEMLLCSIKNIANSAFIRRGDMESKELLRKSWMKWRRAGKVSKEYFEGEEIEEHFFRDELPLKSHEEESMDEEDLFPCGAYDQEVLVAVIACAKSQALILGIYKSVEELLTFTMLNTIGVMVPFMCLLIFALTSIGTINQYSIDMANYLVLGFLEMLIMCYYPHIMSYQVSWNYSWTGHWKNL